MDLAETLLSLQTNISLIFIGKVLLLAVIAIGAVTAVRSFQNSDKQ